MHSAVISVGFMMLAFIFKAVSDKVAKHWPRSVFSEIKSEKVRWWFNPASWTSKWKNGDPEQGERFLGSSRWFVFVTDAWHASNFLMNACFILALTVRPDYTPVINWWADSLILKAITPLFFELFFSRVLEK